MGVPPPPPLCGCAYCLCRSNGAIAGTLVISERAVEKYIASIFSKFGLPPSDSDHRRVLAVLRYLQH